MYTPPRRPSRRTTSARCSSLETRLSDALNSPAGSDSSAASAQNSSSVSVGGSRDCLAHATCAMRPATNTATRTRVQCTVGGYFDMTLDDLRRFAISRSLFSQTTLTRALDTLGFVQADPIRAPARAQDLTLRHRADGYRAGDLEW